MSTITTTAATTTTLRTATPQDTPAIQALYPLAFPEEDLLPLLSDLFGRDDVLSRIATDTGTLTGHAALTTCQLDVTGTPVGLLGPLAIAPEHQRKGIGTLIVEDILARAREAGHARVFVLGDPAYYGRFGFTAETDVAPPHALPPEWAGAWQSQRTGQDPADLSGTLQVPPPWRPRSLWAP